MARKYAFRDHSKLHFVTFTAVGWADVFIRDEYKEVIYDSLRYCQQEKALELYAYCIMTSHLHLIIGTPTGNLSDIVRDFKSFTARKLRIAIQDHPAESRKQWLMSLFQHAGLSNARNRDFQFWQQHNHPIELNTVEKLVQRLHYTHYNPVAAGFVTQPEFWADSSAADYHYGKVKGKVEITFLEWQMGA